MKPRWLVAMLAVGALAAGSGIALLMGTMPSADRQTAAAPLPSNSPSPVMPLGARAEHVGARMRIDDTVADDVLFLIVATLRGRCHPDRAHELPRMAVLARLPTLTAGQGPDGSTLAWRRDVSGVVNDVARQANCSGALSLRIGTYVRVVDPEIYAQAFPDSYFDPDLSVRPLEAHGATLAQRVEDLCASVAYTVLPLDEVRAWQCAGLRAQARSAVIRRCHAAGASADDAANDIRHLVSELPVTCR